MREDSWFQAVQVKCVVEAIRKAYHARTWPKNSEVAFDTALDCVLLAFGVEDDERVSQETTNNRFAR